MSRTLSVILLSMLLLFTGVSTGCVAAAAAGAGAAGVTYFRGQTVGTVEATPERLIEATQVVFEELEIEFAELEEPERGRRNFYHVHGRASTGQAVHVVIEPGEMASRLRVRVGTLGDREYGETVFRRIQALL